jgi:TolA-binding protein
MLNAFIKLLSLCLLISITFSFPIFQSQGQYRNQTGASEITFFGKEETIWIEKREVHLPVMMGQGIKEEPWVDAFDLREDSIGPMKKMSPSTTQPGCAYSSRVTSGVTEALVGDRALYEKGISYYIKEAYEDATTSFQKLIREYPESEWIGSSYYWMGEARYHQGRDGEAFSYYYKVVEKYPKSEFYAYALNSYPSHC